MSTTPKKRDIDDGVTAIRHAALAVAMVRRCGWPMAIPDLVLAGIHLWRFCRRR